MDGLGWPKLFREEPIEYNFVEKSESANQIPTEDQNKYIKYPSTK